MGKSPKKYPIINFHIWNEYLRTKNKIQNRRRPLTASWTIYFKMSNMYIAYSDIK